MDLYVFTEFDDVKIDRFWHECFNHRSFVEIITAHVIDGGKYSPHESKLLSKTIFYGNQHQIFIDLIKKNGIKKTDAILFTNSLNPNAPLVKEILVDLKCQIPVIAVWDNSILFSDTATPRQNRIKFKYLNDIYNYNCFFDEASYVTFNERFGVKFNNAFITGLPFAYLNDVIQPTSKQERILVPNLLHYREENVFFKSFAHGREDTDVIILDNTNTAYNSYKQLLPDVKMMFFPYYKYYNVGFAYECSINNVIPLFPNYPCYESVALDIYNGKMLLAKDANRGNFRRFEVVDDVQIAYRAWNIKKMTEYRRTLAGRFSNEYFIKLLKGIK